MIYSCKYTEKRSSTTPKTTETQEMQRKEGTVRINIPIFIWQPRTRQPDTTVETFIHTSGTGPETVFRRKVRKHYGTCVEDVSPTSSDGGNVSNGLLTIIAERTPEVNLNRKISYHSGIVITTYPTPSVQTLEKE